MNKVKLKVNKHGVCDEFSIDGVPLGQGITKLELVVEPSKPTKLILEISKDVEVECENCEIKKSSKYTLDDSKIKE